MTSDLLNQRRVLVVDDNQTNLEILRQQLEGWNLRVVCADNAKRAMHLLTEAVGAGQPFELAVLDMHMPRMDGLDLARAIRARPELVRLPMMMLTSNFAGDNAAELQALGIGRCVNKPIRRGDLLSVITSLLSPQGSGGQRAPARASPKDAACLRGQVLLVEDNIINQGVARAMLRKLGLDVTLAVNGELALRQVSQHRYDLVLMDCQMPVMDGYQATAAIRALPDRAGLPIVALTANIMAGDEQKCLDAGMNDFLGKPFAMATLRAMLERWLPKSAQDAPQAADALNIAPALLPQPQPQPESPSAPLSESTSDPAAGAAEPAIRAGIIEALNEFDDDDDPGLAQRLFAAFVDGAESGLGQVEAACAAGDAAALARAAHSLKSGSSNVGADALSVCYRELERLGRASALDEARQLLPRLRHEQARAVAELRELMRVAA